VKTTRPLDRDIRDAVAIQRHASECARHSRVRTRLDALEANLNVSFVYSEKQRGGMLTKLTRAAVAALIAPPPLAGWGARSGGGGSGGDAATTATTTGGDTLLCTAQGGRGGDAIDDEGGPGGAAARLLAPGALKHRVERRLRRSAPAGADGALSEARD
jgi:hypothetical protein